MRDLAEVDEQLAALGKPPADVRALLARVLGEDRGRDRLEQLLSELGAVPARQASVVLPPAPPAAPPEPSEPPEPAAVLPAAAVAAIATVLAHDTMVDGPSSQALSLPSADDNEVDDDTAALLSGAASAEVAPPPPQVADAPALPLQADAPEEQPAEAPSAQEAGAGGFAAMFDLTDPPPPWITAPAPEPSPPAAKTSEQERHERRSSIKALLEQSLDPNDFPPTPPAPRVPAEAVASDQPAGEDEDGFEMLVDEEVIELVDDELEIMEDDGDAS